MINTEQWEQRRFVDALRGFLGMAPLYCLDIDPTAPLWVRAGLGDGNRMVPRAENFETVGKRADYGCVVRKSNTMRQMQRRRHAND